MAKLKIWLFDHPFTKDRNEYSARISSAGNVNTDDLVQGIIKKGSELKETTIRSVAQMFLEEMAEAIKGGHTVHTSLFRISLGVSGLFRGKTAQFDPQKNSIKANFVANAAFVSELQQLEVEVLGLGKGGAVIGKVIDTFTQIENHSITPNEVIHIEGSKIKIDGESADNGVYLQRLNDNSRIKLERIIFNRPTELVIKLPDLEPGEYKLEIITQFSGSSKPSKNTKTIEYHHILSIV